MEELLNLIKYYLREASDRGNCGYRYDFNQDEDAQSEDWVDFEDSCMSEIRGKFKEEIAELQKEGRKEQRRIREYYKEKLALAERANYRLLNDLKVYHCQEDHPNQCHCAFRCLGNSFCNDAHTKIEKLTKENEDLKKSLNRTTTLLSLAEEGKIKGYYYQQVIDTLSKYCRMPIPDNIPAENAAKYVRVMQSGIKCAVLEAEYEIYKDILTKREARDETEDTSELLPPIENPVVYIDESQYEILLELLNNEGVKDEIPNLDQ